MTGRAGGAADSGRVALVTGAASGIGRHLVGVLHARGFLVVATDRDTAGLERAGAEDVWPVDRVASAALDVTEPAAWEAALDLAEERFGVVGVLLNVAGYLEPGWVDAVSDDAVHRHLDVNVKGVVFGTRAAARRMVTSGGGHVVNIGSLASLSPVPGMSLYAASKFAVRGFSLSAAFELRPRGVAVTVVMPDAVATPMLDLQRDRDESALTFSGGDALTPAAVADAVLEALRTRPLEVTLPRSRGAIARLVNAAPGLGRALLPAFRALGRKNQARGPR